MVVKCPCQSSVEGLQPGPAAALLLSEVVHDQLSFFLNSQPFYFKLTVYAHFICFSVSFTLILNMCELFLLNQSHPSPLQSSIPSFSSSSKSNFSKSPFLTCCLRQCCRLHKPLGPGGGGQPPFRAFSFDTLYLCRSCPRAPRNTCPYLSLPRARIACSRQFP